MSPKNPLDPMLKSGPDSQMELFNQFANAANNHSVDDVINASANIFVNAIRQLYPTRKGASDKFDELFAKMKSLLLDKHYGSDGRLNGIFPFDQSINVPLVHGTTRFPIARE